MAEKELCVFCGKTLSMLATDFFSCGGVHQPACRECWNKLKNSSDLEVSRLALESGRARDPELLQAVCEELAAREQLRLCCPRCGVKMTYRKVVSLDKSPHTDPLFSGYMAVRPLVCEQCGKIEFYDPGLLSKWEERELEKKRDAEHAQ